MNFVHGFSFKLIDESYDLYKVNTFSYLTEIIYLFFILKNYKKQKQYTNMIGLSIIANFITMKIYNCEILMNYSDFRIKIFLLFLSLPNLFKNLKNQVKFIIINMLFVISYGIPDILFFDKLKQECSFLKILFRLGLIKIILVLNYYNILRQYSCFWLGYLTCSCVNLSVYKFISV